MATENASYISEFNAAYPADGDAVGEGGGTTTGTGSTRGHLNMIKYALKTQFSGLTGTTAITSSEAELNVLDGIPAGLTSTEIGYVDGVTSAIQTQMDTKGVGDAVKSADAAWTGSQRATHVTDNDGSFDLDLGQNFICTPGGIFDLTFTNISNGSGQSGFIKFINTGGHVISLATNTKGAATTASTISTAGTYLVSYFSDGTDVWLTNSAIYA
tara:strand:+ start:331 stop:972 length:642 start_codon:yes stop_codon:yes gene_type:complete